MPKIKYFERFTSVVAELFLTSSSHHNQRGQASNRFSLVYVQSRECFLFPDFLWQTEYLKSNSVFLTKPIQCNFDARQLLYLFYTNDCFSCYFGTQIFSSFFFMKGLTVVLWFVENYLFGELNTELFVNLGSTMR